MRVEAKDLGAAVRDNTKAQADALKRAAVRTLTRAAGMAQDTFIDAEKKIFRAPVPFPERIPICDWLEANIYLPTDSSRKAGKFRAFPYQRDIINDMGDTSIDELVCVKSIRVGWTQMIGLALAYCVAHLGSPAMFVTFNIEKAKEFAKTFWEPLFRWRNNRNAILKAIRRKFIKGDKQDQWSDWYFLNGGAMRIRAAGTSDAFRGSPARYAGLDEPDAENWKDGKEGSKIVLARGRTVEFDAHSFVVEQGCTGTTCGHFHRRLAWRRSRHHDDRVQ
jgi:phage terminase large subunit GpA-like protein